jgi:putative flippase GtrA
VAKEKQNMSKGFMRFLKYSCIGGGTFTLDLILLFVLTDWIGINYLVSAALSFGLAITVNYYFSRNYVFPESEQKTLRGYFWFIVIALSGMAFVVGMMYILVTKLAVYYILARIMVAGITGLWNYFLNLYFNFRVAGIHDKSLSEGELLQ